MSRLDSLSAWTRTVSTQLPHLSRPQVVLLAAWSLALVLTPSGGRTTAAVFRAALWGQHPSTVNQRLRAWCYAAPDKQGQQRTELDVRTCLAPLLRWIVSSWPATHPRLALVLDATLRGDRWVVLACAVV